jgi:hypothetical protein
VTTRNRLRVAGLATATQQLIRNPDRSLFLTTSPDKFLIATDRLTDRIFTDNAGRKRSLVRAASQQKKRHL